MRFSLVCQICSYRRILGKAKYTPDGVYTLSDNFEAIFNLSKHSRAECPTCHRSEWMLHCEVMQPTSSQRRM